MPMIALAEAEHEWIPSGSERLRALCVCLKAVERPSDSAERLPGSELFARGAEVNRTIDGYVGSDTLISMPEPERAGRSGEGGEMREIRTGAAAKHFTLAVSIDAPAGRCLGESIESPGRQWLLY